MLIPFEAVNCAATPTTPLLAVMWLLTSIPLEAVRWPVTVVTSVAALPSVTSPVKLASSKLTSPETFNPFEAVSCPDKVVTPDTVRFLSIVTLPSKSAVPPTCSVLEPDIVVAVKACAAVVPAETVRPFPTVKDLSKLPAPSTSKVPPICKSLLADIVVAATCVVLSPFEAVNWPDIPTTPLSAAI